MSSELATKRFEDLPEGPIGSAEYTVEPADIAIWYDLLGQSPKDEIPMSFSLNWLLEALRARLGGIPAGGVLTRHELSFGATPGMGARFETSVAITELTRRRGLPRVRLQLDSFMDGSMVVRDAMHLIWPDDSPVARAEPAGGTGSPAPEPVAADAIVLEGSFTQDHINRYAELTGDFNPMHVDPETARRAGFRDAIAHGPMPLGLVFSGLFPSTPQWREGFELDARFLGPTYPGAVGRVARVDEEHTHLVGEDSNPLIVVSHSRLP